MQGIISYKRHIPPAHYLLKFESYSWLSKSEKYESEVFEAGGYKWRLIFYPNGDKTNNGNTYISLYLSIAETNNFAAGWEVNAIFHMFVFDQLNDTYLTIEASNGSVKRFHEMKTKWGFPQLLSLETFKDRQNGYLINDSCIFGAEVFVLTQRRRCESVSVMKSPVIGDATFTWEIDNLSTLNKEFYRSEVFSVGGKEWILPVHPNGDSREKGKSFSVFVHPVDWKTKATVHAELKLSVIDQVNGEHVEDSARVRFSHSKKLQYYLGHDYSSFMSLKDLHDASKGFIVNDTLIVKVECLVISETNVFSEHQDRAEESIAAPIKR